MDGGRRWESRAVRGEPGRLQAVVEGIQGGKGEAGGGRREAGGKAHGGGGATTGIGCEETVREATEGDRDRARCARRGECGGGKPARRRGGLWGRQPRAAWRYAPAGRRDGGAPLRRR